MTDRLNTEVAVPLGWTPVSFGAVVTLKTGPFGSALHKSDYVIDGVPLINPTHIRDGRLVPDMSITVSDPTKARLTEYVLQSGDVVMGRRGEMGRCAVVSGDAVGWICGTGSVVVRPKMAITSNFLQKFLSSPVTVAALNGDAVGSTMVNLNQSVLLNLTVNLPPLPEQTRIAEKLDTVLTRVDACRDRLARVAPLLKRFRQSVLAAATSGRLTADWRDINSTNSWESRELGGIIQKIEAGLNVLCEERPPKVGERGLVKISAVTWGFFNEEESKTLGPEVPVSESSRIKVGDLLISRANTLELVGACVIVHDISKALHLSDKVLRLVVPESIKLWLLYVLRSPYGRLQIEALASGNQLSMRNLSQINLRSVKIPVPDDYEIAEIIRRVETLFAFADRLEARLKTAQTAADRLTPALLAKAFRGELVPQDPNDEPAAELLKRLATSRDAAPKAKRGRRSATADTTP